MKDTYQTTRSYGGPPVDQLETYTGESPSLEKAFDS